MPRDPRSYLWDARRATQHIEAFIAGRTREDYERDLLLRSAVERQFEILGEALNLLSRSDPATAEAIADLPRIVAFRNVLIHGYAAIDDRLVWEVATERVVELAELLGALLDEISPDDTEGGS